MPDSSEILSTNYLSTNAETGVVSAASKNYSLRSGSSLKVRDYLLG